MTVLYIVVALATITINGMNPDKKALAYHSIKSLFNKFTSHSNTKEKNSILDLEFYTLFKVLPNEMKLAVWHAYNKNHYTHDELAHNYIIPYEQYFSDDFIQSQVKRYKNPMHWDCNGKFYEYPILRDWNKDSGVLFERENDISKKDEYSVCNDGSEVGPNNKSNISLKMFSDQLRLIIFNDQNITWKLDRHVNSNTKVYCVHPDINKFFIGSSPSFMGILTVDGSTGHMTSRYQKLNVPHIDSHSFVRFGPDTSLFINKKYSYYNKTMDDQAIIHYDYEQKETKDIINLSELFNNYLDKNTTVDNQVFQCIYRNMHRKISYPTCQMKDKKLTYFTHIKDFLYPTSSSDYLLIKFNLKIPVCSCYIKKSFDNYFIDTSTDYYALYNIRSKNFFYLGNTWYRVTQCKYLHQLPHFKNIKTSQMYKYVYDFINYQSQSPYHTFCYDEKLTADKSDNFASRKMVAIIPDDDITRLEHMILASIAYHWCLQTKASRFEGFEIIRNLVEASMTLEQDQNPFKQKRMILLKSLTERVAKKLNIDLDDHINKHLKNNFFTM